MEGVQDAVQLLRSRSRSWITQQTPGSSRKNYPNILNMKEWLAELGYQTPLDLNIIHITGTKGKGSTAAFTESILRAHFQHLSKPIKVGLYTSPHLITERDRIRVNFKPISEVAFAQYFFEVWECLRKNVDNDTDMPGYLQLLVLLSVHIFKQEMVDVAIYEVHAGGRKDATNIFENPIACGFTTIDLDHKDLLGPTIKEVAWHKSGIMKRGSVAFSIIQEHEVAKDILEKEAAQLGCSLAFIPLHGDLPQSLQLTAQKMNASLAIWLSNTYLNHTGMRQLDLEDIHAGISRCCWPGRFHRIEQGSNTWFLDCAHNTLSLPIAMEWFETQVRMSAAQSCPRILIFGHESERDTYELIRLIVKYCKEHEFAFDLILLPPYERYGLKIHDDTAEKHAAFWREIQDTTSIHRVPSLVNALRVAEEQNTREGAQTLITGSTHLVGQALALLEDDEEREA
ncbi:hypothetical protein RRF57_013322 [Xylaria bambusicola]|uniref:tetrahydrofolate synthase n=1 Tax=Xylaria bambusicola TaxID=326684 RepID=A0AAN7ZBJ3_9PEZI